MTTKYPAQIDNNITLPPVIDSITPVQSKVFNDLRAAILAIEKELGVKPSATYTTVRARLDALTTGVGGGVQLGQDLGGAVDAPVVIGIQGRAILDAVPDDGYVLSWNAFLNQWVPAPTANAGVQLGRDLGGTISVPLVIGLQGRDVSTAAPDDGFVLAWNAGTSKWEPTQAAPFTKSITAFSTGSSVLEVGQSIVHPAFTASYNFTTTSVTLTDGYGTSPKDVSSTPTSFSSSGTFASMVPGHSVSFTITAQPGTLTRSTSISWGQKNYYGIGNPGQTGNTFIHTLTATGIAFSSATSFTVNATAGKKIYFATRAGYSAPTFKDHSTGFALDISLVSSTQAVTNGQAFTENYQLWETTFTGLGSITVDVT